MSEKSCELISSRGILKSCDIYNINPVSSTDYLDPEVYSKIKDGDIVYLCTEAVPNFLKTYFIKLKCRIVIVTGDSDLTFPTALMSNDFFNYIIKDDRIIHWFAVNSVTKHSKVTKLPYGLDYHTLSKGAYSNWGEKMTAMEQENEINKILKITEFDITKRRMKAYGNFRFRIQTHCNRREALLTFPPDLIDHENTIVNRNETFIKYGEYMYTLCPRGAGVDCIRMWEVFIMGGIAIVQKHDVYDGLYDDLPVLYVDNFSEINEKLLEETAIKMNEKRIRNEFNYNKLKLSYWVNMMHKMRSI